MIARLLILVVLFPVMLVAAGRLVRAWRDVTRDLP